MNIEVINKTNKKLGNEIEKIKHLINYLLKALKLEENSEFNVIFVNDMDIKKLNKKYRGINQPTDVLSFALRDSKNVIGPTNVLGDIYLSIDTAKRQAIEYDHSLQKELIFLTIHGLLHLLGYDHVSKEADKIMMKKQEELFNGYK